MLSKAGAARLRQSPAAGIGDLRRRLVARGTGAADREHLISDSESRDKDRGGRVAERTRQPRRSARALYAGEVVLPYGTDICARWKAEWRFWSVNHARCWLGRITWSKRASGSRS